MQSFFRYQISANMLAVIVFLMSSTIVSIGLAQLETGWKAHDVKRPQPTVVTPSTVVGGAPSDAVVLFDGTDMSKWRARNGKKAKWKIVDNAMESVPKSGFVFSKEEFGDCQIHVEFASPEKVKGDSQQRGNSGVFLMGAFEIQVLDSFENPTYADGSAGSVYGQHPPSVNASRGPGQWQTYDIVFRRPRFDVDGKLTKKARITVLHNGVLIQDGVLALGPTSWITHKGYEGLKDKTKGPVSLQDHGNPVRYRNIWVRRLKEEKQLPEADYYPQRVDLDLELAGKYVGKYGRYRVELKDERLFLHNRRALLELVPHSATEFGFKESAGAMSFKLDEEGVPNAIEVQLDATGPKSGVSQRDKP